MSGPRGDNIAGEYLPTRIYMVRHGATELTAEDRFAGSTDVPLSDEGRAQIAALAERLRCDKSDVPARSSKQGCRVGGEHRAELD